MYNKHIITLVLSILFFASCQKESVYESFADAIEFTAGVSDINGVETRTTLVAGTSLPNASSFGVLGYFVPYVVGSTTLNYPGASGSWENKKHNCHPDIFYKTNVTYNNGACTYANPEGWVTTSSNDSNPADYTYTFFAYYPFDVWSVDTAESAKGAPKFSYTFPFTSTNTSTLLNDNQIQDVMVASVTNHVRANGAVPLNFTHLLTGLNIKLVNYDNKNQIQVTSVTLSGTFHKKMTVDFDSGAIAYSDTYKGKYTLNEGRTRVEPGASVFLNNGKTVLLISNSGLGSDVVLTVGYSIAGESKVWTSSNSLYSSKFKPTAGTNYTLTLNFVEDMVTLSIESEQQWENGDDDIGNNSTIK